MKEFVTPHLRTVLQTYQNSAPKSLQGPGHSLPSSAASNRNSNANATTIVKKEVLSSPEPQDESPTYVQPPPPPPEIPQPILSASDQDSGELLETVLEAKTIGCFFVGGELRLCLPQFLNTVLTEFSLEQINRIFEELCIFCSQCTPEQLNMFKDAKILPKDVKASGLITLTDAERLCSALLHRGCSVSAENRPKEAVSFKVYHKCFGKCEGICTPQLYTFGSPACIECVECKSMFSPQMFVGHAHGKPENRTCHWGFDSRNWRDYLHVSLEIVDKREIYNELLDNLKVKQQDEQQQRDRDLKFLKRKVDAVPPHIFQHEQLTVIPTKKPKLPDEQQFHHNYFQLQQALCNIQYDQVIRSAFHSWPWPMPYFQQEPILQNPERVVRLTGNERFDGGFQPNVALAPRKPRDKEIEKDKNSRNNVAINSEIQIKQERPSSSDAIIQSPEATPTPTPPQISHPPPPLVSRHTNLKPISLPHKKQHHHHQHLQPRSPDELSSSSEITSSTSPIPKTKDSIKNSKSPLTVISTLQQQQGNKLVQLQHRTQQEIYAAEQLQNPQLNPQTSRIRINKNLMNNSNIIRTPTPDMQNFKPNNNNNNASFPPSSSIHQLNVNPAPTISPPAVALSLISRRQDDKDNGNGCIITKKLHQNGVENGEADSQSHVTASPLTWESSLDALIKDIPQVHQRDKIWKIINKILDDNAQMKSNQRLLEKKYQLELQLQSEQIIDLQREIQYLRQQQLDSQHYHQPMNGVINDSVTVTPVIAANKTPTTTTTMISQPIIKNDIVVEKIKMPLKKSSRRSFEEARVQSEVVNLKTSNQLTVTTVTGNGNNNNPTTIQNNTTKCEDRDSLKNEDTISTTTTTLTTKKPQQTNSIITPTISPTSSSSSPDSAVFDIKHGGSGSDDQKSTTSSSTSSSPSPAGGISIKTEE